MRRSCLFISTILALAIALGANSVAAKVKLTLVTHWGAGQKEFIDEYVKEYMHLHPDIEITHVATASGDVAEYLQKIQVMHASGTVPDIIHIYSPWAVTLRDSGMLAKLPADVLSDVTKNYVPAAVEGTTVEGTRWGIPTEIDNYAYIYNSRLFNEAGIPVPQTWDEVTRAAKLMTKMGADGKLQRAGFAFPSGWPEAVAHPFLAMFYADGGKLFSPDNTKSLLDSPAGLSALGRQVRMFEEGATTVEAAIWNFPTGGAASMIMAPWYEKSLRNAMKDSFADVAATPLPPGSVGRATLLYTWGFAVDPMCANQRAAWDFLLWLTKEKEGGRVSRMGDFLTDQGILPSRWNDVRNHPDQLMDTYTKPFIDSLDFSVPEPVVYRAGDIKSVIMKEVTAAWNRSKPVQSALTAATRLIDAILGEYYKTK